MLSNEQLIDDLKKQGFSGYRGIYYSIFNSKTVHHFPTQGCYGNFPSDWSSYTSAKTTEAGVIVWIQKEYAGAKEFAAYVQSDEFLLRRTLKIDVIEAEDKYGFVWRYVEDVPVFHLMSFMKMCRRWTEHRNNGAVFELLVNNGMKPSLALYVCQFFGRTGDNLTPWYSHTYHGAWADNTSAALWCVYHDAVDKIPYDIFHSKMKVGVKPNYEGTDSWMTNTPMPKGFVLPKGIRWTVIVIHSRPPLTFKTTTIKGNFSGAVTILDTTIEKFIKTFEDFLNPLTKPINPEDEDI